MEESQENVGGVPRGEESNTHLVDEPGRPQCPFCGSSEVSPNEEAGDWSCGKCERNFEPQPEETGEEGVAKAIRAPWDLPEGAATLERYRSSSIRKYRTSRLGEGTKLLLLPLNLQIAFSWTLKLAMILGGIFTVILGAHGLHVHFNAVEGLLPEGRDGADLFLSADVPGQLKGIVEWCSTRGLSSWTIPASLIAAGPFLWILQTYVQARRFKL